MKVMTPVITSAIGGHPGTLMIGFQKTLSIGVAWSDWLGRLHAAQDAQEPRR